MEINVQKNELQREMIMREDDFKKVLEQKERLEFDLRSLKKEDIRIKLAIQEKQGELQKTDKDIYRMEQSIGELKRKLNMLK